MKPAIEYVHPSEVLSAAEQEMQPIPQEQLFNWACPDLVDELSVNTQVSTKTGQVPAMGKANHTSPANAGNPRQLLKQPIEPQRAKVLQAHAIMICLREVLLHADGDDVVIYAEAASAAAVLTNDAAEGLDSVRLQAVQ